jgi:hypothetical protein
MEWAIWELMGTGTERARRKVEERFAPWRGGDGDGF